MSRYILTPRNGDCETPDIFDLVPTEGLSEQIKSIELPAGLLPRLYDGKKVKSNLMLDKLLMKISKANIHRSKDGFVTVGSRVIDTKFDDFVVLGLFHKEFQSLINGSALSFIKKLTK